MVLGREAETRGNIVWRIGTSSPSSFDEGWARSGRLSPLNQGMRRTIEFLERARHVRRAARRGARRVEGALHNLSSLTNRARRGCGSRRSGICACCPPACAAPPPMIRGAAGVPVLASELLGNVWRDAPTRRASRTTSWSRASLDFWFGCDCCAVASWRPRGRTIRPDLLKGREVQLVWGGGRAVRVTLDEFEDYSRANATPCRRRRRVAAVEDLGCRSVDVRQRGAASGRDWFGGQGGDCTDRSISSISN